MVRQTPQMDELGIDKVEEFIDMGYEIHQQVGNTGYRMVRPTDDIVCD